MTTQPTFARQTHIPFQDIDVSVSVSPTRRSDRAGTESLATRDGSETSMSDRLKSSSDDFDARLRDQVGDLDQVEHRREQNAAASEQRQRDMRDREQARKSKQHDQRAEAVQETSPKAAQQDPVESAMLSLLEQRPHPPATGVKQTSRSASTNASPTGVPTTHVSDASSNHNKASTLSAGAILPVTSTATTATSAATTTTASEPASRVQAISPAAPVEAKNARAKSSPVAQKPAAQTAHQPSPRTVAPQIMRGVMSMIRGKGGMVMLKLQPESLGTVRVHMQMRADSVTVRLQAENPEARRLLSESMDSLRRGLQQQGYKVEQITVQSMTRDSDGSPGSSLGDDAGQTRSGHGHDAGAGASRGRADQRDSDTRGSRHARDAETSDDDQTPPTFETLVTDASDVATEATNNH